MNINQTILDDINLDLRKMLGEVAAAHVETGRRGTASLKLTVRRTKEGKRQVIGRVQATIPEGVDDSHTRKGESVVLMSVSDEIPGQQRIDA